MKVDETDWATVLTLTPRETVELIALLSGQLVDEPVPGNHTGAAPLFNTDNRKRIAFLVERVKCPRN